MDIKIQLSDEHAREFHALLKKTGVDVKTFLNTAFAFLKWGIETREAGREVASVDEEEQTYRVCILPILENIKKT